MQWSEVVRQREALMLARLLFPEDARVFGEPEGDGVQAELDAGARALTEREGLLAAVGSTAYGELTRAAILDAFDHARALWPDFTVPTVDEWEGGGANLAGFEEALQADPSLRAVLAPVGLGPDPWFAVFRETAHAPSLYLSREVIDEFVLLEWPEHRGSIPALPIAERSGEASPAYWTLSLIPSGDEPPLMGHNHLRGPHPLIAEMLTLQLIRAREGADPLDAQTFTWLEGRLGEGRLAARHVYDPTEHTIRVSTREWAQQGPHQGARPPIR